VKSSALELGIMSATEYASWH